MLIFLGADLRRETFREPNSIEQSNIDIYHYTIL